MSKEKNLNKFISELIKEVQDEIDEATTSGDIAGYETPNAFGDDSKKSKKKTTTNSLTTNVPPTSMINVDDCVLSRGAIIEPVAVGSRRCVEPLLHDRGDGQNHN